MKRDSDRVVRSLHLANWHPKVGGTVRTPLETLKREKLVLDWRKKQQAKAAVQVTIDEILDRLPSSYSKESTCSYVPMFSSMCMSRISARVRVCMLWRVKIIGNWYRKHWIFNCPVFSDTL